MVHNRGYARAVAAATLEDQSKVDAAVDIRMRRQEEKDRRTPPPFELYLVDEAAIRRRVGMPDDQAVMPTQLRELAARVKDDERLTVRIIPFIVGAHMGLTGPFILLEFEAGLPDILYIDMGKNGISMVGGDEPRVARYRDAFETLLDQALPAGESIDLLLAAADEMS
jgi:hypothetical protein